MSNVRYSEVKRLFLAVCDRAPAERNALLDDLCADNPRLRAEIESLLSRYDSPEKSSDEIPTVEDPAGTAAPPMEQIGQYKILREIGRGGMGIVYLGSRSDDQFKRRVAIKVLKRGMDTKEVLQRFDQERQVLGALNHPGIARLYDGGETDDGLSYFVMEYVEGLELEAYCDVHRLHIDERLELFRKVCAAVHYAHQNLVVHRDLKPSNILITKDGAPKLLDFGIAKLLNPELSLVDDVTGPEFRVMTPEYASPEQVRGDPIATTSDVYSLGVLLYELVSGHAPYRLKSRVRAEIERVICDEDPERPSTAISRIEEVAEASGRTSSITPESVSRTREGKPERLRRCLAGDIDNIVMMAMRKEPMRRYESAEQLSADIQRHLDGMPVIARTDTLGYRVSKFVGRHRGGVAAAATIAVLLVGGIVGTTSGWRAAEAHRVDAESARDEQAAQRTIAEEQREIAVEQREVAEEQRQVAEEQTQRAELALDRVQEHRHELIEMADTLMVDIHDEIAPLDGALPARDLLVRTAYERLGSLKSWAEEEPSLLSALATAHDRIGAIHGGVRNPSRGELAKALENYEAALLTWKALAGAGPEDTGIQAALAGGHQNIGDIRWLTSEVAEALKSYEQQLEIRERLAADEPGNKERLADVAVALQNVGKALFRMGMTDKAKARYDRSIDIRQKIADDHPGDPKMQRRVSSACMRIANLLNDEGDHGAALEKYERALSIRVAIVKSNPDVGRYRRDAAIVRYFLGETLQLLDRNDEALSQLDLYMETAKQRVEDNPEDARSLRDLAAGYERRGRIHLARNDAEAGRADAQAAQLVILPLSRSIPDNAQYGMMAAQSHELLGLALEALGDRRGALAEAERALAIIAPLAEADPDDAVIQAEHERIAELVERLSAGE